MKIICELFRFFYVSLKEYRRINAPWKWFIFKCPIFEISRKKKWNILCVVPSTHFCVQCVWLPSRLCLYLNLMILNLNWNCIEVFIWTTWSTLSHLLSSFFCTMWSNDQISILALLPEERWRGGDANTKGMKRSRANTCFTHQAWYQLRGNNSVSPAKDISLG